MDYSVELLCMTSEAIENPKRGIVEDGGKVLLPPSVLEDLVGGPRLPNPLLFKIENFLNNKFTNVGVLEFSAMDGTVVLPSWVLSLLGLISGQSVIVSLSANLPVAKFARFQPKSKEFLNISDPKAVLENSLRKFACLTTGDVFQIDYNNRKYSITVEETRPSSAVNIIECDMEVEFSAPEDYEEPEATAIPISEPTPVFMPFAGQGQRLDGKPAALVVQQTLPSPSGQPDYEFCSNTIQFFRSSLIKDKIQRSFVEE